MAFDQRPQPVGTREVGRAFVEHEPRAEHQRPGDRPRTHHPAEVGEPEQRVARAEVELVRQVLRGLDREAAVDVDGALRSAGRARRVDEHVRRLGIDVAADRRRPPRRATGVVPPRVAPVVPRRRDAVAGAPHDDDAANRRTVGHRGIGDGLERHPRAASQEPVRGDQHGRLAVGETGRDRRAPRSRRRSACRSPAAGRAPGPRRPSRRASAAGSRRGRRTRRPAPTDVARRSRRPPPAPRSSGAERRRPRPPRRAPRHRGRARLAARSPPARS